MSAPEPKKPRRPSPTRGEAYGILNPWGDFWTYETFKTESEARLYIARFWSAPGFGPQDLTKFQVVPCRVTVSAPLKKAKAEAPSQNADIHLLGRSLADIHEDDRERGSDMA